MVTNAKGLTLNNPIFCCSCSVLRAPARSPVLPDGRDSGDGGIWDRGFAQKFRQLLNFSRAPC